MPGRAVNEENPLPTGIAEPGQQGTTLNRIAMGLRGRDLVGE